MLCKEKLANLGNSLFVEDKIDLIEEIHNEYSVLSIEEKEYMDNWLGGRYKKILYYISKYQTSVHIRVDFAYDVFRWGQAGIALQDIDYAFYLIFPIINKNIQSSTETFQYANFAYGTIMFHYYRESIHRKNEMKSFYEDAYDSLTLALKSKSLYVQQRSYYFLTHLYSLGNHFEKSLISYYKSLSYANVPQNHYGLIYTIMTDYKLEGIFNNIKIIFTKQNIDNNNFWILLSSKIKNKELINKIDFIMNFNHGNRLNLVNNEEIESFSSLLANYINRENQNIVTLQKLYQSKSLTNKGKSEILFLMGVQVRDGNNDLNRAMLMFCESIDLFVDKKTFVTISQLLLNNFSFEIREILKTTTFSFKSLVVKQYCYEQGMGKSAWERFKTVGFVSGNFEEEVEFLEYIKSKTDHNKLIDLIDTRLAFLYYKGHAGVRIHDYNQPNYHKAEVLFRRLQDNPLVTKYLKQPVLDIYNKLEVTNDKENYIYFENKKSDKLIIVFACAFGYAHYSQLYTFYKNNKTNVLFLNNPKLNWYHDSEWDRVTKTIEKIVKKGFNKNNVISYFGSMGGYMALKVGLTYGFKTIVFNPQIDMDIWLKHRSVLVPRLSQEKELVNIQDYKTEAFELTPIYYLTSSSIEDVEAFSIFIQKVSNCNNGLFIIEKIADNSHAGIFGKLYKEEQQNVILNIANLQEKYFPSQNYQKISYRIDTDKHQEFWNFIIDSMAIRLVIQIVKENIFVAKVKEDFSKKEELSELNFLESMSI